MASPNQLSFLPDDYLERKQRRRTNAICASLFVVVVSLMGSAFWYGNKSLAVLRERETAADAQVNEAAKRIELVRQMQEKQKTMNTQAELTAGLLEKVPRSHLLAEITNAMPSGVSLLEFDLQSRVRTLPPPTAAPKPGGITTADAAKAAQDAAKVKAEPKAFDVNMRIQGVALTDVQVATFITKLTKSKLFKEVNLVVSEEFALDDQKVRKFSLEILLDPQARAGGEPAKDKDKDPTKPLAKDGSQKDAPGKAKSAGGTASINEGGAK